MTENLINSVIDTFNTLKHSRYNPDNYQYITQLYNNLFMGYAIVPSDFNSRFNMRFDIFRDRPDYGTYDSIFSVPVYSHVDIGSLTLTRLLIRRCRKLISKICFKNIDVVENDEFVEGRDEYYRHIIITRDNGVNIPVYMILIPCLAYMINNDDYIKQLMDVEFTYEIDNNQHIRLDVNSVHVSNEELNRAIESYNMIVYEE